MEFVIFVAFVLAMMATVGVIVLIVFKQVGEAFVCFVIGVICWVIFGIGANNISESRNAVTELKDKCYLESNDFQWNVSSGKVTMEIEGVKFNFTVSDFEVKGKVNAGPEVHYTPSTMSNCFSRNR